MKRVLRIIGLIQAGVFGAPMVAAQDYDVWVDLFAMAQFPLLGEDGYLRYPTGPSEYERLTRWNLDKWRDRSPEYYDLVAIVQNPGTQPVGSIELRLTRHVKIGERRHWLSDDPEPHRSTWSPHTRKNVGNRHKIRISSRRLPTIVRLRDHRESISY